jgi:regulator of protease activity HflC (stomatin/prohibitin superfamily)
VNSNNENEKGRFHFLFIPPEPCKHGAGTFCCLAAAYASFLPLAKLLHSLAWANNFDNYSFLLDHLSIILNFMSEIVLVFAIFAALRLALDFARRKFWNEAGEGDEPRKRVSPAGICAFSIRALNGAYCVALSILLFLFARRSWAYYSPLLFYRHYRGEVFQYSSSTFFITSGVGLAALALTGLFKRRMQLGRVSCAPALHNVLQTLCWTSLCAAATIALKRWGVDLTLIAECALAAGCVYFAAGMLRGVARDMLRGDMTGAFSYEPLFRLPERIKFFDGSVSWEERTGLSFKSMWCVSYAIRLIPDMMLAGAGILLVFTSMYAIEPHQEALLYRLGTLHADSVKSPGLHFKLPWPIDRVHIYDVSRVRNMQIGYIPSMNRDYLWNSEHGGTEHTLLLGGGNEMIAVNMRVSYRISDLFDYVTRYANPEELLSSKAYEIMMQKTMSSDLSAMLTMDRKGLAEELAVNLAEYSWALRLGIHVNEAIIESIHPPIDLADVYHGVVGASIQKETIATKAEADAEKARNAALRQKESAVLAATASQIERTAQAHRDMAVYENAFLAYESSPECYKLRKKTDSYSRVIQGQRLYVFSPDTVKDARRYLVTNGLALASVFAE